MPAQKQKNRGLKKVNVLDHGFVRLVRSSGTDLDVVRAARVSYNAVWRAGKSKGADAGLLRYLLKNKHTSPFEHVVFTFEIKCPIFVARQWHRHRTWSYNEISGRYTMLDEGFYYPTIHAIGMQSKDNKQARNVHIDPEKAVSKEHYATRQAFLTELHKHTVEAEHLYKKYLGLEIPRELARIFLPLNTYTRFFGTVDLHNLMHFIRLRMHPHAQHEIQEYGVALYQLAAQVVPETMKILEEELRSGA